MFTFAAFCYMLSLVLCASLIFFAIWHVSVCIFDVLCENMLQNGMHVLEQRLLHQTKLSITRSKPPWYYECLWHVITKFKSHWWSFECKLIVKLDLGHSIGAYPDLVAPACVSDVFCTPFLGFPISLMEKTPLWVVSDPVYPFQETHTCVKPPYSSTVQATVSVIFRQQFVPDLFWCYAVLYVCALYARCNTVFFFFLEESCIKALAHIHSTARLL